MHAARKITVEVPVELLAKARAASGSSLTETVRQGLRLVAASEAFKSLRRRRGSVRFSSDLSALREDRGA